MVTEPDVTPTARAVAGLSQYQKFCKRTFDIMVAAIGLSLTWWLIIPAWLLACLDTRRNGFFTQERVGMNGVMFMLVKLRSMIDIRGIDTSVTRQGDPRITKVGSLLRKTKLDELPQLWNVLTGDMSLVGPRPDIRGFADKLEGEDRIILSVRPGITGPASIKYRNEEELLEKAEDPEKFNRDVIWPHKVRINKDYVKNYSFLSDIGYIIKTISFWDG